MGKNSKKEKSSKHKKDKAGKKGKKRSKKEKKGEHRHRSSSSSDSSGTSGSDGERLTVNKQLQMGRAAARAVREILAYNHALRKELRELVRQLDNGDALDVSGIPDDFLRSRLLMLFDNLVQLRKNSAGQYFRRQGAAATVLSFVAPLLEESQEQLAPYRQASQQHAAAAAAAEAATAAAAEVEAAAAEAAAAAQQLATAAQQQEEEREAVAAGPAIGPAGPPPASQQRQQRQQEGLVSDSDEDEEAGGAHVIGPAAPPPGVLPAAAAPGGDGRAEESEGEGDGEAAGRRVAGPAMPPAEWLAAAAQMEYPLSEEEGPEGGGGGGGGVEEGEGEDEFLVGPPPPEIAEELDLASMDERTAEVVRVLRVLQQHAADHAKSTAAEAAEQPPDAYEVLGVAPELPAGEVKRRYWRLSLLIHPDKCDHPRAHDAFQAVTGAAKELQDAGLREKVDARRRDAELRREFRAAAAVAERQRQWRVARGQATAEDLAGPAAAGGPTRDTWMTELPPERQQGSAAAAMPTGPFSGFSLKGVKSRGDTSGWTMTPQQRAAQLENGSAGGGAVGGGGGPLLLAGGVAGGADAGVAAANPAQAARMAAAVDRFNAASRGRSLMEAHAERLAGAGEGKKRKKRRTGEGEGGGKGGGKEGARGGKGKGAGVAELGYDPTQHPWRPFDREKDLGPGLDARANAAQLLKGERALGSKFGGGQGGGRTFL